MARRKQSKAQLVRLQDKDLQAAARHAKSLTRGIGDRLRRAAINSLLEEGTLYPALTKFYAVPLTQSMVLAHLLGEKRAYLNARQRPKTSISLGLYENTIRPYAEASAEYLELITHLYNSRALRVLEGASEAVEIQLRAALTEGFEIGETVGGLKARLGTAFESAGLSPVHGFQIETIVRTQAQLAFQSGKWRAENLDPDISEVLWGYEYVTVGDARVRPEHADLDGTILPKGHIFWQTYYPPNGWNCRCQAIPLFEPERTKLPTSQAPVDPDFNFNPGQVFSGINRETAIVAPPARNLTRLVL